MRVSREDISQRNFFVLPNISGPKPRTLESRPSPASKLSSAKKMLRQSQRRRKMHINTTLSHNHSAHLRFPYHTCLPLPSPNLSLLEILVDRLDFAPSCASCSRKSDHSAANDSFDSLRLGLSVAKSVDRDGVLGVRCQGDIGVLRFGLEAPGRARPACSRCSRKQVSFGMCWGNWVEECTICPTEQSGNNLEYLELFGIGTF